MTQTLEQRVAILEDIESIKKLKATYCYLADAGMGDAAMMELFGHHFTDDIRVDFEFLGKYQGRASVIAFYRDQVAQLLSYSAHMVTNPRIEVNGNEACGEWYVLVPLTLRETQQAAWLQARYQEEYAKQDGCWKWRSITARFEHITPFEEGWAKVRIMDEFLPQKSSL